MVRRFSIVRGYCARLLSIYIVLWPLMERPLRCFHWATERTHGHSLEYSNCLGRPGQTLEVSVVCFSLGGADLPCYSSPIAHHHRPFGLPCFLRYPLLPPRPPLPCSPVAVGPDGYSVICQCGAPHLLCGISQLITYFPLFHSLPPLLCLPCRHHQVLRCFAALVVLRSIPPGVGVSRWRSLLRLLPFHLQPNFSSFTSAVRSSPIPSTHVCSQPPCALLFSQAIQSSHLH